MKDAKCMYSHPVIIFWLGVLTGALAVGFLFLSGVLHSQDYQSAILKLKATQPVQTQVSNPIGGDKHLVAPIGGDKH